MIKCKHCQKFFVRLGYLCSSWTGECDCPKCQGFCRCHEEEDQSNEKLQSGSYESIIATVAFTEPGDFNG